MTVKAHKLVYIGQGSYRCANCGGTVQKSDVGEFLAEDCPSFPGAVDYSVKLAEIQAAIAEIKKLTKGIDAKLPASP